MSRAINVTTMKECTYNPAIVLLLPLTIGITGCARMTAPLDLNSTDPKYDQSAIAGFHSLEAAFFRLKAQELSQNALVYQNLFGDNSEWVKGARLLEQFYVTAAAEQDRLASRHLNITGREPRPVPGMRPTNP